MTEEELKRYISLYHGTVFRLAYSYLKNEADAEDVCEEAFIKLYLYQGSFERDENCKAWLIRVTINLAKNVLKSSWFTLRTELDENLPTAVSDSETVSEYLAALPLKYRLVIHLHYYEGYSVKEISKLLGKPVSTITTQLSRARERLKAIIEKEESL